MQEYTVYGTYTMYITIRVEAGSPEEALDQANTMYGYYNAAETEEDESFEILDTFINFEDVNDDDD